MMYIGANYAAAAVLVLTVRDVDRTRSLSWLDCKQEVPAAWQSVRHGCDHIQRQTAPNLSIRNVCGEILHRLETDSSKSVHPECVWRDPAPARLVSHTRTTCRTQLDCKQEVPAAWQSVRHGCDHIQRQTAPNLSIRNVCGEILHRLAGVDWNGPHLSSKNNRGQALHNVVVQVYRCELGRPVESWGQETDSRRRHRHSCSNRHWQRSSLAHLQTSTTSPNHNNGGKSLQVETSIDYAKFTTRWLLMVSYRKEARRRDRDVT
ncbi:hypothetical protein J6590_025355 [Homalodisca vitripennis]|nr:hypothetical protein J6590_025355 [Homalodisca vitripennis]